MSGEIFDEAAIARLRAEYQRLICTEMRLSGYVPRYDIDSDFTIDYNVTREIFEFNLSIYGVYVGKKQSECIQGIDGTKVLYIARSKSKGSSQEQGSQLNQK